MSLVTAVHSYPARGRERSSSGTAPPARLRLPGAQSTRRIGPFRSPARTRARASSSTDASSRPTSARRAATSSAGAALARCGRCSVLMRCTRAATRASAAALSRAAVLRLSSFTAGMPTSTVSTARTKSTAAPIPTARNGTGGTSTSRGGVQTRSQAPSTSHRLSLRCSRPRGMSTHLIVSTDVTDHPRGIEVQGLVREFKEVTAVAGIDLGVAAGEIYGFLGPNGAGKSTTVLMLTTLLPPTSGRATVGGYDIAREGSKVRAVIGAALQEAALDPLLTGREHLQLQATLQGLARAERKSRASELLERVGLTEAADRKVRGYSGGMKRRLDLALALVHRPRILFLDEPTTGLDPQSRTALWEEVQRLVADRGVTVFLTTQYLEEADVLARRIGIIDNGQIVAEGTTYELKAQIGQPSVEAIPAEAEDLARLTAVLERFGEPVPGTPRGATVRLSGGEATLADVVRALDAEDLQVEHLQLHQPTLNDVFLAKTGRSLEGARQEEEQAREEPTERVAA